MLSGDGWVVRVRPRGGRLSPAQAAGIADLAGRFGNGRIDLSARANLQIRGVTEAGLEPLVTGLRGLDLVDDSAEAEARRNIVVTPFHAAGDGTEALSMALETALSGAADLPGKFGFAIDTGAEPVLRGASADIRIERVAGGLVCYADGARTGAATGTDDAVTATMDLAEWFLASGGVVSGRGRMAALIASGVALPERFRAVPVADGAVTQPEPGPCAQGQLVGLSFGATDAATLAALARLGPIRLTPWRMLLVESGAPIAVPGVVTRRGDPLLRVSACTGAPDCPQGRQPVRDLARALAQGIPAADLHVSGCAKGCAHPGPAALTLVGTSQGFDLVRDGRAWDSPAQTGLPADPAMLLDHLNRTT
ncbi:MAG: precorrin-3B synthase [Paracoccaceae bacterium]